MKTPRVYLIGGGPGDPGLLTLRGAELLGRADVVLYDGLANPRLLEHASAGCECICVGKRGHGGTWNQEEINDTIVEHVRAGKSVARLKGGDTSIFARTAEEIDRLVRERIGFEVVPGITTALATSAYTGIPITHRDWASAAALLTAQLQPSDGSSEAEESVDWNALAQFPGTLVLYMGLSNVSQWSQSLIEHGRRSSTPVALVRRVSWPDQQTLLCDLGTVSETLSRHPTFAPPSIAIIGEVVRMGASDSWFTRRPLFGKSILVTSPSGAGNGLVAMLAEQGAMVHHHPAITLEPPSDWEPIDRTIQQLETFDWVLFSSVHGVHSFFERLRALGRDSRSLHQAKIGVVGHGIVEAVEKHGIRCDLVPATPGAWELAQALAPSVAGQRLLLVRNPDGKERLFEQLISAGASCTNLDVYHQREVDAWPADIVARVAQGKIDCVTATSSNIAKSAVRLLGSTAIDQQWICLAPGIAETLRSLGCSKLQTAPQASMASLVELMMPKTGRGAAEKFGSQMSDNVPRRQC